VWISPEKIPQVPFLCAKILIAPPDAKFLTVILLTFAWIVIHPITQSWVTILIVRALLRALVGLNEPPSPLAPISCQLAEWWEVLVAIKALPEDFVWLTRILAHGLQVTFSLVSVEFASLDNYPSARLLQPELENYLQEDLNLGHLAKVHVSQVASPLCIHPIALIPKPG
jgi:hypothetical protein